MTLCDDAKAATSFDMGVLQTGFWQSRISNQVSALSVNPQHPMTDIR